MRLTHWAMLISVFSHYQDTSLRYKTMNMGLVHYMMCLFAVLIAPTSKDGQAELILMALAY